MPYLVGENLFIGNIGDAAEILKNGSSEITHIVSVLSSASISFFSEWQQGLTIPSKEIKKVYFGGSENDSGDETSSGLLSDKLLCLLEYAGKDLKVVRMGLQLRDTEKENLLDYLDVCLDFIDKSRKEGSVLVHCVDGVSTSAAIITAYLMRTEHLSQEGALESLRQSCEFVCPNDGFLNQLKMYEEMGFKVDHGSPVYKAFRLQVLGESYHHGDRIDSCKFASRTEQAQCKPMFRCKKCRRLVAVQDNVVDHIPGLGEESFRWHKRKSSISNNISNNMSEDTECSSIFFEPLGWMNAVEEGATAGKLFCAHCEARLGYFNWAGIQCSCGSWITPAFQLHKARVDISTV